MQIGPPNIYRCSDCGKKHSNPTLMSGNTFGAKFYSDGYFIAQMMPKYPFITKCCKCKTIFWLDDRNLVDADINWRDKEYFDEDKYPGAEKLEMADYIAAIEKGLYTSDDDEFLLRQQLLWKMNDQDRYDCEEEPDVELLDDLRRNNILRLIEIIESCRVRYKTNPESMMLILAELYRLIGEFDSCLEMLKFVTSKKYQDNIDILTEACDKGCVKVLEIIKTKKV